MVLLLNIYLLFSTTFSKEELSLFLDNKKVELILNQQNEKKGYISLVEKEIVDFIKNKKNTPRYLYIVSKFFNFVDKDSIFNSILEDGILFRYFLEDIVNRGKVVENLSKKSKKIAFSIKTPSNIRELLAKYMIFHNVEKNNTVFFNFIETLHVNNIIKYKEDELYIQAIIPILAERYKKEDFKYYKKFLQTENKVMIETVLYSIPLTKDIDFIPLLKNLESIESIYIPIRKATILLTPKDGIEEIDLLP